MIFSEFLSTGPFSLCSKALVLQGLRVAAIADAAPGDDRAIRAQRCEGVEGTLQLVHLDRCFPLGLIMCVQ